MEIPTALSAVRIGRRVISRKTMRADVPKRLITPSRSKIERV